MNRFKRFLHLFKKENLDIDEEFILVNSNEIYGFIEGDERFIELINSSLIKIKEYFPNSRIYLNFFEDPEDERGDCIFASIQNPSESFESNLETLRSLSSDLNSFPNFLDYEYYLDIY